MVPDKLFMGCSTLLIEYNDIIRSPYLTFIQAHRNNPIFAKLFDMHTISSLDELGLYEWYKHRKHINPLLDLHHTISDADADELLHQTLLESYDYFKFSPTLNSYKMLAVLASFKFIKKVYVYSEREYFSIEKDIHEDAVFASMGVQYLNGDFSIVKDVIKDDATIILSDITKVDRLREMNILHCNSVIYPIDYRYNYSDDKTLKVDMKKMSNEIVFKYASYKASEPSVNDTHNFIVDAIDPKG